MDLSKTPLVSVIVITYNSSVFVERTLNSIYNQTYINMELIVSDDCSTDDTTEKVRVWLSKYRQRFVNSALIETTKNSGIPANCNRGLKNSNGNYVKFIAGDDMLTNTAIYDSVECLELNPGSGFCFGKTYLINSTDDIISDLEGVHIYKGGDIFNDLFFLKFWTYPLTILYVRKIIEEVGLFDEDIWVEDYLMVLKISYKYRVEFLNKFLGYYRMHNQNSGKPSAKLLRAQIQSVRKFNYLPQYKTRMVQLEIDLFYELCITNKREALILCLKNLNSFFSIKFFKSFIKLLFVWN